MGVGAAVWASVRCAHDTGTETVAEFCGRIGVSQSAYYRRRKKENWAPRQKRAVSDADGQETGEATARNKSGNELTSDPARETARGKTTSRKRLIKRLYSAIDHELERLETGPFAETCASVPEIERTTRTLMNMIRSLEKVLELETDKHGKPKRKRRSGRASQSTHDGQPGADTERDAERMRQDIAERLGRLHAQWSAGGGS